VCDGSSPCSAGLVCNSGICVPAGSVGTGGACYAAGACAAGLFCNVYTCIPQVGDGGTCYGSSDRCVPGLVCNNDLCQPPAGEGATCTLGACADGLTCVMDGGSGVCEPGDAG
jgi:hypothetical protein